MYIFVYNMLIPVFFSLNILNYARETVRLNVTLESISFFASTLPTLMIHSMTTLYIISCDEYYQ